MTRIWYSIGALLVVAGLFHLGVLAVTGGPWDGPVSFRKPFTFGISFGLSVLALTWVAGFVRLPAKNLWLGAFVTASVVEVVMISLQAWRGVPSHFNTETAFDALVARSLAIAGGVLIAAVIALTLAAFRPTPKPAPGTRPAAPKTPPSSPPATTRDKPELPPTDRPIARAESEVPPGDHPAAPADSTTPPGDRPTARPDSKISPNDHPAARADPNTPPSDRPAVRADSEVPPSAPPAVRAEAQLPRSARPGVRGGVEVAGSMRLAVRAGFVTLLLAMAFGGVMIAQGAVEVATGSPQLAYTLAGSMKPAHAVLMHGVLLLPALAALPLAEGVRLRLVRWATFLYGLAAAMVAALAALEVTVVGPSTASVLSAGAVSGLGIAALAWSYVERRQRGILRS